MIRRTASSTLVALLLLTGCDVLGGPADEQSSSTIPQAPTATDDPALDLGLSRPVEDSVYPDVGDPRIDTLHYDLDLAWDRDASHLRGVATITLRATRNAPQFQLDLGAPLEVSQVRVDGEEVEHGHRGKDLVVRSPVRAEERYRVQVDYDGTPQPIDAPSTRNDVDELGFSVTAEGEVWTMQEPYGAYTWYPVNDQPADKALYDITIRVAEPWVGVANGQQRFRRTEDGETVTSYHLDEPAASYLITLAIGDYDYEADRTESGVPLNYWVPRRFPDAMERVRRSRAAVEWAEEKLGPWPYSSAGTVVVDGTSGMETQTLITLANNRYALSDEVLVHEMVHHYFGNQVTPRDWRDVWLSEGITTYLQGVYRSETTNQSLNSIMDEWAVRDQELRDRAGPPGDYDPGSFAAGNVYYGPALMWHELRRRVGDEVFWETMRAWPGEHDNGNAGRRQMIEHVEVSTGLELSSFFNAWLLADTTPPRGK